MHESDIIKIQQIETGKGIQHVINAAYAVFGNPIVVHGIDYRLIASTGGTINGDALWNELISTGEFSKETLMFFKDECFIDHVADAETVTLLSTPRLTYDRLFGKIFNADDIVIASVLIVCSNIPYDETCIPPFKALRKKLSDEAGVDDYYQKCGRRYIDWLIRKLIVGDIDDKAYYSGHIANIYHGLKQNIYIAAIDFSRANSEFRDPFIAQKELLRVNNRFKYAVYSGLVVAILSSDSPVPNIDNDMALILPFLRRNNACIGISDCFENLFETGKYYDQAFNALLKGKILSRNFLFPVFRKLH